MKEIKVFLFAHENDDYNEIWKVFKENKYFARHTYNGGEWCFVSDAPYGYCELVTSCPDDYCFIVCTKRGKELFRSSNADETCRFPSLRQKCMDEWNSVKSKHPHVSRDGVRQWLRGFLTPEIKEKLKADPFTNCCIEDNFCYCWYDCIESEKVSSFSHLGIEYDILRNKMQSRYNPEAVWYFYQGADGFYAGWEPVKATESANEYRGMALMDKMNRLDPMDEALEIVDKMAESNMGATHFVAMMLQNGKTSELVACDNLGIYGKHLYMFWNDCCQRNLEKACSILKQYMEGRFTKDFILGHLNEFRGESIDIGE